MKVKQNCETIAVASGICMILKTINQALTMGKVEMIGKLYFKKHQEITTTSTESDNEYSFSDFGSFSIILGHSFTTY